MRPSPPSSSDTAPPNAMPAMMAAPLLLLLPEGLCVPQQGSRPWSSSSDSDATYKDSIKVMFLDCSGRLPCRVLLSSLGVVALLAFMSQLAGASSATEQTNLLQVNVLCMLCSQHDQQAAEASRLASHIPHLFQHSCSQALVAGQTLLLATWRQ